MKKIIALCILVCSSAMGQGSGTVFDTDGTKISDVSGQNNTISFYVESSDPNQLVLLSPGTSANGGFLLIAADTTVSGITHKVGSPTIQIDGSEFTGTRQDLLNLLTDGVQHFVEMTEVDFTNPAWSDGLYFGGYHSAWAVQETTVLQFTINGSLIGDDHGGGHGPPDPVSLTYQNDYVWKYVSAQLWDGDPNTADYTGGQPCDGNGPILIDSQQKLINVKFDASYGYNQWIGPPNFNWDTSTDFQNITSNTASSFFVDGGVWHITSQYDEQFDETYASLRSPTFPSSSTTGYFLIWRPSGSTGTDDDE